MKLLPLGLVIAALAVPAPCAAGASLSRCAMITPQQAFERADAVFRGVVVSTPVGPEPGDSGSGPSYYWALVRVTTRWKGAVSDTARMRMRRVGGVSTSDREFNFARGAEYLVYARYSGPVFTAPACGGTRRIEHASRFLEALPEPVAETAAP